MSTDISQANSALMQAWVDGNFFAATETALENLVFVTPKDKPWAKITFVPLQPVIATLGAGGLDRLDGMLQVDLNYPLNSGTDAIQAKAKDIRNAFTVGRRFVYEGVEVITRSCGRSQGRMVEGFYRISVTIVFYCHLIRQTN